MDAIGTLAARVALDLAYTDYPQVPWVRPKATNTPIGTVFDVVIEGGGMQGLGVAHALRREQIRNILVLDENPAGFEGPWTTYARMHYLRTPKDFVGPDLGVRSLSYRDWFDANHGPGAWAKLDRVPTVSWMEYLCWFRSVLDLPVINQARLTFIEPTADDLLQLSVVRDRVVEIVHCRHLVRATGILGSGGARVPRCIAETLPSERYAHSSDRIDFDRLKGCRVAMLGAGASAFDNAATALESGAARVDMLMRRRSLPTVKVTERMNYPGFLRHFAELTDAQRWRVMVHAQKFSAPPPFESVERASRLAGYALHGGTEVTAVDMVGDGICIRTTSGHFDVDFVICATGFITDLSQRPELKLANKHIKLWHDCYLPPAALQSPSLGRFPYLGPGFEFIEKDVGAAPWITKIREYGFGAMTSMGPICVGLNGMTFGTDRLLRGITGALFADAASDYVSAIEHLEDT